MSWVCSPPSSPSQVPSILPSCLTHLYESLPLIEITSHVFTVYFFPKNREEIRRRWVSRSSAWFWKHLRSHCIKGVYAVRRGWRSDGTFPGDADVTATLAEADGRAVGGSEESRRPRALFLSLLTQRQKSNYCSLFWRRRHTMKSLNHGPH